MEAKSGSQVLEKLCASAYSAGVDFNSDRARGINGFDQIASLLKAQPRPAVLPARLYLQPRRRKNRKSNGMGMPRSQSKIYPAAAISLIFPVSFICRNAASHHPRERS